MLIKEVYCYIRASTAQQVLTLEMQRNEAFKKAQKMCVQLKEENIFIDAATSGYSLTLEQRPGLKKLMARVEKGLVDTVIVSKRDRLTRRAREYLQIAFYFHSHNVKLVFSDENEFPFTTENGWMMECVLAALLQKECEQIRQRVVTGLKTQHRNGKWSGGTPGYGFKYDKATKIVQTVESEVIVVRIIFSKLSEGSSPTEVARFLNENYPDRTKWTTARVHKIASNPLFLGVIDRFGEKVQTSDFTPIISYEIWEKAQETLDKHPQGTKKRAISTHNAILDGLVSCSNCENAIFTVARRNGKYFYSCPLKKNSGCDIFCKNHAIEEGKLEQMVLNYISDYFSCIDRKLLIDKSNQLFDKKIHQLNNVINSLNVRLERKRKEKIRKSDEFIMETNLVSKNKINNKMVALNLEEIGIYKKISQLKEALMELDKYKERHEIIVNLVSDWTPLFNNSFKREEQKFILQQIISAVVITPFAIEVALNDKEIMGYAD